MPRPSSTSRPQPTPSSSRSTRTSSPTRLSTGPISSHTSERSAAPTTTASSGCPWQGVQRQCTTARTSCLQPTCPSRTPGEHLGDRPEPLLTSQTFMRPLASRPPGQDGDLERTSLPLYLCARPEFLDVARHLNGTDLNGDGQPDYALCMQTTGGCMDEVFTLGMILTGMLQTKVGTT